MSRRQGFTLVEMLVAVALTLFIMVILSQAFITGLETFTQLKGLGDMEENLRTGVINLHADLQLDHFGGGQRLSDPASTTAPTQGFFAIYQAAPSTQEGVDSDNLPSNVANATNNNVLSFAVKGLGNRRENFFAAPVPDNTLLNAAYNGTLPIDSSYMEPTPAGSLRTPTFNSQWAEVVYFLNPSGTTVNPTDQSQTSGGTPLYTLNRGQFVVVPTPNGPPPLNIASSNFSSPSPGYLNIACNPDSVSTNPIQFYSSTDLAAGLRTIPASIFNNPATITTTLAARGGYAPVLSNVVSFNVRIFRISSTPPYAPVTGEFEDVLLDGSNRRLFDSMTPPTGYLISGLQISLRVWDQKTQQSRQITIVQDL